MRSGNTERILTPGNQSILKTNGETVLQRIADTSAVIAWKNGLFQFKDASIETVMRQIGRWYNAEIVYDGKVDYHFNATIYRQEPVSRLLEVLEATKRVHFKVEGRKIVVRP